MSSELNLLSFIVFILLIWGIIKFHWLRVITTGLIIAVWGAVVLIGSIVLSVSSISKGQPFTALIQLALGGFMCVPLYMTIDWARKWVRKRMELDAFWLPWNAE